MPLVLKGWDKVNANLRTLAVKYPQELGYALREEGMAVMDQSAKETPLDQANWHEDGTPHLIDTADVQGPLFEGDNIRVVLSYDTPYAIIQHENLDFHHTTPGTKAKYLEDPLNQRAKYVAPNLVRAVNLERMNVGYSARPTASLMEEQMLSNRRQAALNKYGHLGGRYL